MMTKYIKYPRTPHLPWSREKSNDDITQLDLTFFQNREIIVTEKMDGENTTIYPDHLHARSLDSIHHPSRNWVKSLQGEIGYQLPSGWRICGENLYAQHSIAYKELKSFFLAFSIWNEENYCLSWDETLDWLTKLQLHHPKILYQGLWNEKELKSIQLDTAQQEGYVVRITDSFHYKDFSKSVAKWVRKGHVQTDQHWMHSEMIVNEIKSDAY